MTIQVAVDLLSYTGARGGTETYAREICSRFPQVFPEATLMAITGRQGAELVRSFFPGDIHVLNSVGTGRVSWAIGEIFFINGLVRRLGADVVWCPANFGPVTSRVPRVTTVHDVTYHRLRGNRLKPTVSGLTAAFMARTARTSSELLTGSAAARSEIEEYIGIPAERVAVVPHGTMDPPEIRDPWAILQDLNIPRSRPIVLSTGNRLPHKNFEGLVRAVAALPEGERPLLIVPGGGEADPLRILVARLGVQADVLLPGWVTSTQLEALFAAADLYVCPSTAEGFGLPVIDAMRRNCLVLANDIPVLREVGGTAARYADARSPEEFGAAILDALQETSPEARDAGRVWSDRFTWEASAAGTANVIRRALALPEQAT